MAALIQETSAHVVESAGSDYRSPTSFGLPGYGTGRAKFTNTDYTVYVRVYEDLSVQVRCAGTFTCPDVLANDYPSILVTNPANFAFSVSGGHLSYPSSASVMAEADIDANSSSYTWGFDSGWKAAGKLTDYGGSDTGTDGYIYVGGTGTYQLDDPVYPTPVRVTVPGFLKYLGFYPWARYGDGAYKSCNRAGGSLTLRKDGIWRDVRNNDKDHSVDQAHYRAGGAWQSCKEIGSK